MSKKDAKEANAAEIHIVKLSQIEPNPSNPRKSFPEESLKELAESIKLSDGVQQPILLRPNGKKSGRIYMIVYGERRFRASKLAGRKDIRAEIREMNDIEAAEAAFIENMHREDINPMHEAAAMVQLMELKGCSPEELAVRFGKSLGYVRMRLKLNSLTEEFKGMVLAESIKLSVAMAIASYPADIQDKIYQEHFAENCSKMSWDRLRESEIQQRINGEYTQRLDCYCFDKEACASCPYNTKSSELNLGDQKEGECLNGECLSKRNTDYLVETAVNMLKESDAVGICQLKYSMSDEDAVKRLTMMGHEMPALDTIPIPDPNENDEEGDDSYDDDCEEYEDDVDDGCQDGEAEEESGASEDDADASNEEDAGPKMTWAQKRYAYVMGLIESGEAQKYVVVGRNEVYMACHMLSHNESMSSAPVQTLEKKDVRNLELSSIHINEDVLKLLETAVTEALGYDGIIDSTVSKKFANMNLDEGTTHYVVFNPNQIKSATDNVGTFDINNPDIRFRASEPLNDADIGKPFNEVRQKIPYSGVTPPAAITEKREFETEAKNLADFLEKYRRVKAADGMFVNLRSLERPRPVAGEPQAPTLLERAKHLIGKENNKGEIHRELDYAKLAWVYNIPETLHTAQAVFLNEWGSRKVRAYVKNYDGTLHIVLVNQKGETLGHLITQFPQKQNERHAYLRDARLFWFTPNTSPNYSAQQAHPSSFKQGRTSNLENRVSSSDEGAESQGKFSVRSDNQKQATAASRVACLRRYSPRKYSRPTERLPRR